MFEGLKNFIRKVGVRVGIIKELESLTELKGLPISEGFYHEIQKWRALHQGYYKDMHQAFYYTVEDGRCERTIATMQMPKVAVQELATLIFNERCEISVSSERNEQFGEYIKDVFKDNHFYSNFQQQLEFMFATGGLAVKPYIEDGKVKLSYATADCFVPISWNSIRITEGAFVNITNKDNKTYTHIEWHIKENGQYVIKNQLFESTTGASLGTEVSLNKLFDNLEPIVYIDKSIKRPLFSYFKPNLANNVDLNSPLGISIYANAYDTLKAIDIAFDSLQREFRLGRKRILVSETMLKPVTNQQTGEMKRYFDPTDEVYEGFLGANMDSELIKDMSAELRIEEHKEAIKSLLDIYAMQLGFSAGTFSFDGQSTKTATEVVSEQSKTFKTKQSHENVIEQGIIDLIECIAIVSRDLGVNVPDDYEVSVFFDDSIVQDRNADILEQIQLLGAGLQSKLDAIITLYGLTEEEARIKLQKIKQEELNTFPEVQEIKNSITLGGELEWEVL